MVQSFLKIAFRNFFRSKGNALLNIAGLAIGMSCCLLTFEYVAYERSYENFNPDAARIFRVQDEEYQHDLLQVQCAAAMPGVAPALKREFPEIEQAGRLHKISLLLGNDSRNIKFLETSAYYADQSIVSIFHINFVRGSQATALLEPGKMILSETLAKKYFGDLDPIGKTLTVHSNGKLRPLEITGIFRDYPNNSHIRFNVLVSYPTYSRVIGSFGKGDDILETSFSWTDFYTYCLLRKGVNVNQVASKLPAFIDRHYNDLPKNKNSGDRYSLSLVGLHDIHLYSHYTEEAEANGDGQSVSFLFIIAFFIIGIAWINYINLATARSLERAREVGVRKVLGAVRRNLVGQFMLESFLLNLVALLAALLITCFSDPLFAKLSGRPLPSLLALSYNYKIYFLVLFLGGTLLSGLYPSLVLSRYQPVIVLKGAFKNAAGGRWLRKGLIVGQFAASILLIGGTLIVYRQLHYMSSQNLGTDISQTLVLRAASGGLSDSAYHDVYGSFKKEILQLPGVNSVTASSGIMGEEILWSTDWQRINSTGKEKVNLFHLGVDPDFIGAYGLKMLAGTPFNNEPQRRKIILNQTAVRVLGFASPSAAIGQLISGGQNEMDSLEVSGVIADYHNEGLQKSIQPLVLFCNRRIRGYYSVKIPGENPAASIASIKKIWDAQFPADPFDYFFLDEFFNRQYAENIRFGQVFALFAALAIGIACFGLFGLSAYTVLQRTREIGIRKVLGAPVSSLLYNLSAGFISLVVVAFIIAVPISWLAMDSWLQGFAYRTGISWWIYGAAGFIAMVIALLTVGYQAIKAAYGNPIKSLRTE